jgi:hypothetical protein
MAVHSIARGTVLFIDTPDGGAPQWATPVSFTSTGIGQAYTVVSTTLGALFSADDDLIGKRIRCTDSATVNKHRESRILAYDDATDTITIDALPVATASGDTYQIIDNPAPYIAEDTGTTTITAQDADLSGADDYWNGTAQEGGPYLEVIKATTVVTTSLRLITDFVDVGGVVSAAMGGNTAIGDLYEIWQCPEVMNGARFECAIEPLPREQFQGTFDTPGDAQGAKTATGSFEFAFRGPGSGRNGSTGELHRMLSAPLDDGGATGDLTVNGAGSVDSIPYDAGSATVGKLYCTEEGSAFMCTAAGTPAVPSPSLRSVAADDSTVTGLRTYTPSDVLNYHLASKQYQGDGILEYIWGVAPELMISGELNQFLKITSNMTGSDWYRTYKDNAGVHTRAWEAKRPSVAPVKIAGGRVVLEGVALRLKSFEVDFGLQYEPDEDVHAPNGLLGQRLNRQPARGKFLGMMDATNDVLIDEHLSNRQINSLLIQVGSQVGFPGVLAFWAYDVQITNLRNPADLRTRDRLNTSEEKCLMTSN